jgi:hypothetical protein
LVVISVDVVDKSPLSTAALILFHEKVKVRTASFNSAVSEKTHLSKESSSSSISESYKQVPGKFYIQDS